MSAPRVTVVGSFAVGLTLRAPRFPVAGETLLATGFDQGPGGKGSNQAVQAARMGAEVEFVGVVGADELGDIGRALWAEEGVGTRWLTVTEASNTGLGSIMLDEEGENRILLDPGANDLLSSKVVAAAGYGRRWLRAALESRGQDPQTRTTLVARCEELARERVARATEEEAEAIRVCAGRLLKRAEELAG